MIDHGKEWKESQRQKSKESMMKRRI